MSKLSKTGDHMKQFLVTLSAFVLFQTTALFAKDGYKIKIKFTDVTDSTVFLAHYYGKPLPTIYKTDSAKLDRNGFAILQSEKETLGGIYILLLSDKKTYLEFLLNNGDEFDMTITTSKLPLGVTFKNSIENEGFIGYLKFLNDFGAKQQELNNQFNNAKNPSDSMASRNKLVAHAKTLSDYRRDYVAQHPKALLSSIFNGLEVPVVPEKGDVLPSGKKDSNFAYNYYKKHYWDHFNFKDDRIIHTPLYDAKIDEYMNKLVLPIPDSVIKEGDALLAKARGTKEVFKYTLWWLTHNAESSKIMGMDVVFVHLVENYYMKGDATWLSREELNKYFERASKIAPNLIGNVAPEIVMEDLNKVKYSLSGVKAKYTLLIFWDPTCGHCTKEIPAVDSVLKSALKNKDIKVFAVKTEGPENKWTEFIEKNSLKKWLHVYDPERKSNYRSTYDVYSTPVIYVLDEKKIIKAKRIDHTNLVSVFEMLEAKEKDKK